MARIRTTDVCFELLRVEAEQYRRSGGLTDEKYREIVQQLLATQDLFARLLQAEKPRPSVEGRE